MAVHNLPSTTHTQSMTKQCLVNIYHKTLYQEFKRNTNKKHLQDWTARLEPDGRSILTKYKLKINLIH